jgi:hypothetical protein
MGSPTFKSSSKLDNSEGKGNRGGEVERSSNDLFLISYLGWLITHAGELEYYC